LQILFFRKFRGKLGNLISRIRWW